MIRNIIVLLAILAFTNVYSQQLNNGVLTGRVLDSNNGQPIPFANVIINGTTKGTSTDNDGNFILTGLTPGYIEIVVSSLGFNTFTSDPIMITNAKKAYFEVQLEERDVQLEEVNVKASFFRKKEESPVSLRRISIAEIERSPGGNRDISKVIQAFPGVASTPAYRNDIIVRGGGSSENRFFLDGVEIPNINHFATQGASGGPVGIINVDLIREVNFYSGAFPANRGNALSSVLEFNQIDGNTEKLKFKGSLGASDLSLTLDGPMGKNTSYLFSVRRSYLQFLFTALELPFLPTYNDFQFKVRTRINDHYDLTILGLGAYDISRLNKSANKTAKQRYLLGNLPENDQWNYTFGMVFKHYKKKGYDNWVLSRNYLNNAAIKYRNNIEVDSLKILDYSSSEAENKFRYEHSSRTNSGYKINYGVGFEYDTYENNTQRANFDGTNLLYESTLDLFKWGIFGQVSKNYVNDKLALSFGLRADANNYSSSMNNMFEQLAPRLSASYALLPKLSVNANLGRYFQAPPYTALGFRDNAGSLINKENGLKYISANHYVFGFDYLPNDNSKLSIEGFYKTYNNYPLSVTDSVSIASKGADFGSFGDEELTSSAQGRAYGMEFLFQSKDFMGFNVILSYTLVRSESTNKKGNYIPTAWDNKHILNLTALKSLKRNWDVGFKWRFVGGAPYTPWDLDRSALVSAWNAQGRAYYDYSQFNQLRLGPFHQLDIRVDKKYFFNRWSLRFYLDIQNLYNYKSDEPEYVYRELGSNGEYLPATGNPLKYPLEVGKGDGAGRILPTIGAIVEF